MKYCKNINWELFKVMPDVSDDGWVSVDDALPQITDENINDRMLVKRKNKPAHFGPLIWETWLANVRTGLDNIGYWYKNYERH